MFFSITSSKTSKGLTFTTILLSSLWLAACGGGSSDNNDASNNGSDSGSGNGSGNNNAAGPRGFDADGNLLYTGIPSVSGLASDADYQSFLFYSVADKDSSSPDRYTLKAINPSLTPLTVESITTNVQKMDNNSIDTIYSFPAASVNNGQLSDYHVDRMMFLEKLGSSSFDTKVVKTTGTWPPTPQSLALATGFPGMAIKYALQHNLTQPAKSTFSYVKNSAEFEQYLTTIEPGTNTDFYLGDNLDPVASLVTGDQHAPNGWIMGEFSSSNSKLFEYANDGTLRGELKSGGSSIPNVVMSGDTRAIPGTVFADGSQLLAIHQIDQSVSPWKAAMTVYRYIPGNNGSVGTLEPLKNTAGEHLTLLTNTNLRRSNIAVFNDATYMFDGNGNSYDLYRLEKDQWSKVANTPKNYHSNTVVTAGDFMVWQGSEDSLSFQSTYSLNSSNNNIVKLDSEPVDGPQDPVTQPRTTQLSQPFFGNNDAMVYYNRERSIEIQADGMTIGNTTIPTTETREWVEAVARKADGTGTPTVITHAFWTAASTNGKGTLRGHMSLFDVGKASRGITSSMELSELFLVTKHYSDESEDDNGNLNYVSENLLVAVSAADPTAAMVELGKLPSDYDLKWSSYRETSAAAANVGEVGSGPHRLLGFKRKYGSSSDCALVYVNTRDENSLKDLEPTNAGKCQTVRGF